MNLALLLLIKLALLPLPFFNAPGSMSKVADPTFGGSTTCGGFPCTGCNYTVTVACATGGSHIFYTKDGSIPTHTGDVATGTTTRIGSNSGTVASGHVGGNGSKTFTFIAIGYLAGMADSNAVVDNEDFECPSNF